MLRVDAREQSKYVMRCQVPDSREKIVVTPPLPPKAAARGKIYASKGPECLYE